MDGFIGNVIKYLLFATNFLILLMGCIVLGFGIYVLAAGQDIAQLIKEGAGEAIPLYSSAAILLIILSLLIIIVTFFGCCGALKENKCMLGTYFAIVLVFFIIFIVAAIIGYTQSEEKIQEPLKKAVKSYGMANKTKITDAWNYVQKEYKCCGANEWKDWQNDDLRKGMMKYGKDNSSSVEQVPESCCIKPKGDELSKEKILECQTNPDDYDLKGCYEKLKDSVKNHKKKILGVALTILVIMFLNMMFAFALCTMVKK